MLGCASRSVRRVICPTYPCRNHFEHLLLYMDLKMTRIGPLRLQDDPMADTTPIPCLCFVSTTSLMPCKMTILQHHISMLTHPGGHVDMRAVAHGCLAGTIPIAMMGPSTENRCLFHFILRVLSFAESSYMPRTHALSEGPLAGSL
jgi:hypothetical protein